MFVLFDLASSPLPSHPFSAGTWGLQIESKSGDLFLLLLLLLLNTLILFSFLKKKVS